MERTVVKYAVSPFGNVGADVRFPFVFFSDKKLNKSVISTLSTINEVFYFLINIFYDAVRFDFYEVMIATGTRRNYVTSSTTVSSMFSIKFYANVDKQDKCMKTLNIEHTHVINPLLHLLHHIVI